jgi:hypothetical protein
VQPTTESIAGIVRSLAALVRRPLFWLLVQMLAVWLLWAMDGGSIPQRVADTPGYLSATRSASVAKVLTHPRTYGYPLFLKFFTDSSGEVQLGWVPTVQRLAFLSSILFFWWALSRFSGGPWLAFAAATALLHSPVAHLARRVQPDFLAAAFIIMAVSSLILLVVRRSAIWWVVLTITVFYSYQLRPSGVFLIGLVPLLGWVYQVVRNRQSLREGLTFAGFLALACLLPFLSFATVRWVTVGHFGLFTWSKNAAGAMAMCFLDGRLISELPEEHQRLARKLHRARRDVGFEPMRKSDDPLTWYVEQYDDNLFRIGPPVVRAYLRKEASEPTFDPSRHRSSRYDKVEVGHRLGDLAKQVVRRRPGLYKRWVKASLRHGLSWLDAWAAVTAPFVLLIPSLALALVIGATRPRDLPDALDTRGRATLCLTITVATFSSIYLLLISAVSFPLGRYMASVLLFVPPLLAVLLLETWRLIVSRVGDSSRGE